MKWFLILLVAVAAVGGGVWFWPATPEERGTPESSEPASPGPDRPSSVVEPPVDNRVAGHVLDSSGRPAVGASVKLFRSPTPWPWRQYIELETTLTDATGRFQLETPREEGLLLEVIHQNMARHLDVAPPGVADVRVQLEPGFALGGVLLGALGQPAPGVPIMIEPGPWGTRAARSVVTDVRGGFEFRNVAAGNRGVVRLTARHPSWPPVTLSSVPVGSGDNVRVQLRGAAFSGIGQVLLGDVRSAGDNAKSIGGVRVQVYPSNAWNGGLYLPRESVTDPDGRFRLTGFSGGRVVVVLTHPQWSTVRRVVSVARGEKVKQFEMVPRSRVRGRFTGGEDVAGLALTLTQDHDARQRTEIAADGTFEFPGTASVGSATVEFVDGQMAFASTSARKASITIEDSTDTLLEFEAVPPSVLVGRVVDGAGSPLAGVRVSTPSRWLQRRDPSRWVVSTDAEGRYRILGLPPIIGASLRFEHPEHAAVATTHSTGNPGEVIAVPDVELPRAGVLRGRVTRAGEPLSGASVFTGRGEESVTAVTGADGRYELRNVPPGRYRVMARWSTLPVEVADGVVDLESEETEEVADIEFPPGRTIQGLVTDTVGAPIAEALVFVGGAAGASSATDSNGRFEMNVPDKDLELSIYSPGYATHAREPAPRGVERVIVRLPWLATGRVSGVLLGLPGPRPIRNAILRVEPVPGDVSDEVDEGILRLRTIRARPVSTAAGRLSVASFPAGRSIMTIHAPGFAPATQEVTVQPGRQTELGTIRLEPGATVRGVVRDQNSEPIAGAYVHIGRLDDLAHEIGRGVQTGPDGRFEVSGAAADASTLVVGAAGYASRARELRLPDDVLGSDVAVELQPMSTIVVTVREGDQPVSVPHIVEVRSRGDVVALEATEDDGVVRITVPHAGTYDVSLFDVERAKPTRVVIEGEARAYEIAITK